jgi:hypothetical protein
MYSHPEESNYMKKLLTITKKRARKGYDQEHRKREGSQDPVNGELLPVNG